MSEVINITGKESDEMELEKLDNKSDFGYSFDSMDVEAFMNLRDWLLDAIESKGAVMDGAGIGGGKADIDFTLHGAEFNVTIKPRAMKKNKPL